MTNYGARVNDIYLKKLWIPAPGMLEQIKQQLMIFNNADPMRQVEMLRRVDHA